MQPGLFRLGTDFGNGEADARAFPFDPSLERYTSEKARVLSSHPERASSSVATDLEECALRLAEIELRAALVREGHPAAAGEDLSAIARGIAEDLVVVHAPIAGEDRALWVHVCFPSGWRPERIVGRSFLGIHARIPAFEGVARAAPSLVEAMVTRGPYVRFVWTISADDALDHHPEHGARAPWTPAISRAFLRVERQATLPVPEARAAVFAIRTYLYDFDELSVVERSVLAQALRLMPPEIQRYKSLEAAIPRALELLAP
jgi:hypothetical protein